LNSKRIYIAAAVLIAIFMLTVFAFGCNKTDDPAPVDSTEQTDAMITASPDGEVTASPTEAPVITESPDGKVTASPTKAPLITASPDGEVTASPTQEPTGTSVTDAPDATNGSAGETIAPINTQSAETPRPVISTPPFTTLPGTTPTPTPRPSDSPTAAPDNDFEAHYAGEVVDCTSLSAGGSFYWTLDILNEHSRMWSGQWLVDYPEEYLSVDSYSTTWSGSVTYAVSLTWDDEEAWSDKPAVVCNPEYMGQTGGVPVGESGNMYANVGMYITSFNYYGLQMSGSLIRFKFIVNKLPSQSAMQHDGDGYYLEIPVTVIESTATIDKPNGNGFTCVTHGIITSDPGKLYFKH